MSVWVIYVYIELGFISNMTSTIILLFQTWPFSFQGKVEHNAFNHMENGKSDKDSSSSSISDDQNLDDLVSGSP